ncbi:MAG: respiratory nitrate reductase subunit gamma [Candidatus Latescibacterota bacterium]|nr:MAG: respiratory nitrate reductase subunit gamma [Candidatus Latescibacterota bacterium]
MSELQLLMYVAYVVFFIGTAYRARKMATMPVHLRWDLYPIPHEKNKHHYGGSYFEEIDWWTKPAEVSVTSELKEMSKEIIFIQSMYYNNRPLWIFSFPFHFGLYLSIVFVLMIFLSGFLGIFGFEVSGTTSNFIGRALHYLTMPFGIIGSVLGCFGAVGLLISRLTREELKRTSVRSDYFNLVLLIAVFASGLYVWATEDMTYTDLRAFFTNLVSFKGTEPVSTGFAIHMILAAAFLIYLPFTHMTHFVGKYFTYHKVRWEDEANVKGSKLEKRITEALGYRINWSAPHIKKGTWAEAATATEDGGQNE